MSTETCMYPDCGNEATTRGLCRQCYATAAGYVHRGLTTWEKLEKSGKCKPALHLRRSVKRDWFVGKGGKA